MTRRGAPIASTLALIISSAALAQPATERPGTRTLNTLLGAITGAPADAVAPEQLDAILAELASEEFTAREAATERLATDARIPTEQLEALAGSGNLDPEPQARVLEALRRRFVAQPRPAIGITMQQPGGGEGVAINNVDQRFPAFNVLQAGDVVLDIAGQSLADAVGGSDILRTVVLSFVPGEEIPLTILRNGQQLNVLAPLGLFDDLTRTAAFSEDALAPSWDIRMRRRGLLPADSRAIEVNVPDHGLWIRQRRGSYDAGPGGGLVAGGQAAAVKDEPILLQSSDGRWRDVPVRERAGFRAAEGNAAAVPAPVPNGGLRDLLTRRLEAMQEVLRVEAEAINDPRLSPEQRAALRDRLIRRSRELQNLQEQIMRLPPGN